MTVNADINEKTKSTFALRMAQNICIYVLLMAILLFVSCVIGMCLIITCQLHDMWLVMVSSVSIHLVDNL